jgi:AcrR family transcriptional regulator
VTDQRGYHHGDLRRAVLDAALQVITADGPGGISLRDLARRAGVSHTAPAHHFKDKAGLLTEIAIEGYDLLAAALDAALVPSKAGVRTGDGACTTTGRAEELLDLGAGYVGFALEHRAHFEVMFRPDLCHADDHRLTAARARTNTMLQASVEAAPVRAGRDAATTALGAWALAHGFSTLWVTGSMAQAANDQDPVALFRTVAQSQLR